MKKSSRHSPFQNLSFFYRFFIICFIIFQGNRGKWIKTIKKWWKVIKKNIKNEKTRDIHHFWLFPKQPRIYHVFINCLSLFFPAAFLCIIFSFFNHFFPAAFLCIMFLSFFYHVFPAALLCIIFSFFPAAFLGFIFFHFFIFLQQHFLVSFFHHLFEQPLLKSCSYHFVDQWTYHFMYVCMYVCMWRFVKMSVPGSVDKSQFHACRLMFAFKKHDLPWWRENVEILRYLWKSF